MKSILKHIRFFILLPFIIPHIIAYSFSSNKSLIIQDVIINAKHYKYSGSYLVKLICLIQDNKYYRSLFYYRLGSYARLFSWYLKGEQTFVISSKIAGGFYVAHPFATIIYARSIGANFVCHQNTTIGNKNDSGKKECPIIGDNVTIGANSCVIGDIRIGNNVIVGAGAVVVKDVPDNSIVVGNPARIVKML